MAQAQAPSLEAVLARESVYRAIGEGYFRPAVAAQINFPTWYQSELADFLQVSNPNVFIPCLERGSQKC